MSAVTFAEVDSWEPHRAAEDGAADEALGEDVAGVVPAGVQPEAAHRHQIHLLVAAALHTPCTMPLDASVTELTSLAGRASTGAGWPQQVPHWTLAGCRPSTNAPVFAKAHWKSDAAASGRSLHRWGIWGCKRRGADAGHRQALCDLCSEVNRRCSSQRYHDRPARDRSSCKHHAA